MRSLLLGTPLTSPVILDDAVPVVVNIQNETNDNQKNSENGKSEDAALGEASEKKDEETTEGSSKPSPRRSHQQQKNNEEIQKKLDFISECDWPTLVGIARQQIEQVMDPFLKKHGVL